MKIISITTTSMILLSTLSAEQATPTKAKPIEATPFRGTFYPPAKDLEAALAEFAAFPKRASFQGFHQVKDMGPHDMGRFSDTYPGVASREKLEEERRKYKESGIVPDTEWVSYWMTKSDEEIDAMISPDNPRSLVPNYLAGHPLRPGNIMSLIPIWGKPNWFYSPSDNTEWGPGAKVTNPGTGETVVIEDNGTGWVPPEGFPNRSAFKFVAAYRSYMIRKLVYYPYAEERGFDGPSFKKHGTAVYSLAYAYAITGEQKYADRVLLILTALSRHYPSYTSLDDTGVGWSGFRLRGYVDDHNFENGFILNMVLAYDLVWDGIAQAKEPLAYFQKKGETYASARDLAANIEKNLFAYSWEFLKRAIRGSTGNSLLRQGQAALTMGNVFGNDNIMEYVLAGPKSLDLSVTGSFYRDGRFWEDTCTYCYVVDHTIIDTYQQIKHYRSPKHPTGLPLDPATEQTFQALVARLDDWQINGRLYGIGDTKVSRSPVMDLNTPFRTTWTAHEAGLTVLRTPSGKETGNAALFFHGNAGNGHGHLHQLMLKVYGQGYDFSGDLGYPANFTHPKWTEWTRATITHPTVVVDQHSQNVGTVASMGLFATAPWGSVVSGFSNNVYQADTQRDVNGKTPSPRANSGKGGKQEVPTYHRTAIMLEVEEGRNLIVDLFRVEGGKIHDLPFHSLSGKDGEFFQLDGTGTSVPLPGTLAGESAPYGARDFDGYSYLKDVAVAHPKGSFQATWRPNGTAGPGYRVTIPAGFNGEAFTAKGESEGLPEQSPWDSYLVLRRKSEQPLSSLFMTIHEAFKDTPLEYEVTALPTENYPAEQMAAKLEIKLKNGDIWKIESALSGSPSRYEMRGKERISVSGPKGKMTVNWSDKDTLPHLTTGKITGVNYPENSITLASQDDLSKIQGQNIFIKHPLYSKTTTFEIAGVKEQKKGEWEITLNQHPVLAKTRVLDEEATDGEIPVDRISEKLIIGVTLFDGKVASTPSGSLSGRIDHADISSIIIPKAYQKFWMETNASKKGLKPGEIITVYDYGIGDDAYICNVEIQ